MAWDDYEWGEDVWGGRKTNQAPAWGFNAEPQADMFGQPTRSPLNRNLFGTGFDTGLSTSIQGARPEDIAPIQRRGMVMPEYDYGPMTRYQQYLQSEPDRANYKQNTLGKILTAAGAGVESYQHGLPAGIKLAEYMQEKPYVDALKQWQAKGGRYEAAARLADTQYKTKAAQVSRNVDDERAERALQIQQGQLDLATRKFQDVIDERQRGLISKGFTLAAGPKGNAVLWRKNPQTGALEIEDTPLPNERLTAAQQQQNIEMREQGANRRANLAATTSSRNVQAGITSRESLAEAAEKGKMERFNNRFNFVRPASASAVADPVTAVTQGFKEFNSPDVITMKKDDKGKMYIADYEDDPVKVKAYINKISRGDPNLMKQYAQRWVELTSLFEEPEEE